MTDLQLQNHHEHLALTLLWVINVGIVIAVSLWFVPLEKPLKLLWLKLVHNKHGHPRICDCEICSVHN